MEFFLPPDVRSAYDMAQEWGCSPEEAHKKMVAEGWKFHNYDDCGQPAYSPPNESGQEESEQ